MITVVDYGMGNLGSVLNMLRKIGSDAELTNEPARVAGASKLILPGVGAFDQGVAALERLGLARALRVAVLEHGAPILGICLGMQLLGRRSEEGVAEGLGFVEAEAIRIRNRNTGDPDRQLRVPHMGWNDVRPTRRHPLVHELDQARFYFVHSFHVVCNAESDILLETTYGDTLTAAYAHGPIMGVQFHPEKSHKFGMALLKNFAELV